MPTAIAGIPISNPYGLGALSPADATEQVFPQAKVGKSAGHDQAVRDQILASAQAMAILNSGVPGYQPGTGACSQSKSVGKAVLTAATGTAGGLLLKIGAASGNPILLAAGGAAELASLVFSAIFGHHQAAVAKEQSVLCAAVPAANQALQVIDQAVQSGQFTPQQGIAALSSTLSGFQQAVAGIIHGADPTSSGECNAACVMLSNLRAIVLVKQSQYQDMLSAAVAPGGTITSAVSQAASSAGLPTWLLWAAGAYLAWELL